MRNNGYDVIYIPELTITHLKAPFGGFRTKFEHPWDKAGEKTKPSPTIMFVKQKYSTMQQLDGYKTMLFFKVHKYKIWKIKEFENLWNNSLKWSKKIVNEKIFN